MARLPPDDPVEPAARPRYSPAVPARRALLVLTLVNLLNYLDRYVVSALVESLRSSGLVTSDAALGALMTGFVLVYMLASPLFGALADAGRARPPLLAVGVALWSVATAMSAFAGSYAHLLLARGAVGVGEAAYGTVAPAMIADAEPEARRGRAFAVFYAAIPIGSALGYVVGGLVDRAAGWRAAFLVAGAPGLLLAWACLRLPDPHAPGAPRRRRRARPSAPTPASCGTGGMRSPCSATPPTPSRSAGWASGFRRSSSASAACRERRRRSSRAGSSW